MEDKEMEVDSNFSDKAKKDLELVKAALGGSQAAYSEIMVRYREAIFFLILKMVRNDDDAEDLAIETFSKAFLKLNQYTPQYAFSTWLFRIATNHSIDFLRKKRLKTTSIDEAMEDGKGNSWKMQLGGSSKDPEEKFIEQQKITLMRKYVDDLDEPYRTLVELRYFKEWSYEEIATHLDLPLGTVKAQLFRARAILSDLIRKSKKSI
tara:strand:+ start:377 stop:997 length:621 start_codon:yes stop_codon:yes gene_type:complete